MKFVFLYFAIGVFAYLFTKLLPSVFGRSSELFECVPYYPHVGIPAILFWPCTIILGLVLQLLSLKPSIPAAEDRPNQRVDRFWNSKDIVVSTPRSAPRKIVGYAKCISDLRPSGKVEFDGQVMHAITLDQYIEKNEFVTVIEKRENELVVVRAESVSQT